MKPEDVKQESARRTRRSFLVGGAAAAAGAAAAYYIDHTPEVGRLQGGLRRVLNANASVNRAVFGEHGLAPEYPVSQAVPLRLNGTVGIAEKILPESWRLQLVGSRDDAQSPYFVKDVTAWEYQYGGDMDSAGQAPDLKSAPGTGKDAPSKTGAPKEQQSKGPGDNTLNPTGATDSDAGSALAERIAGMVKSANKKRYVGDDEAGPSRSSLDIGTPGLLLSMDELKKQLPFVEQVTQFKCVEGWSNVTHWGGFRLRDLLELHPPQQVNGREPRFLYMETPDGNYYGGYDLKAARHPQSLLVTHMHGEPLTQEHGAPLRLFMPIKYGYKQVKRIGLIAYTDLKPDDYWEKLGYDWYAGL